MGKEGANLTRQKLGKAFSVQVETIKRMLYSRHIPVLFVSYETSLESPREMAAQVNAFLGSNLDEARMASAVDPRLRTVVP